MSSSLQLVGIIEHKWAPTSSALDDDEQRSLVDALGSNTLDMPLDPNCSLGSLAMPSTTRDTTDADEITAIALLPCSEDIRDVPLAVGDASGKVTLLSLEPTQRDAGAGSSRLRYRTMSVVPSTLQELASMTTSPADRCVTPANGANNNNSMSLASRFTQRLTHVAFSADLDRTRYPPSRKTVSEKITTVSALRPQLSPHSHLYVASNDLLIKLFRVRAYRNSILDDGSQPFTSDEKTDTIQPLRTFVSSHTTPIVSTHLSADGQTMLSLDCFKLLWWNLEGSSSSSSSSSTRMDETSSSSFSSSSLCSTPVTLFDMSPEDGEDVTEVATSAAFHPSHTSLFLNTSTSGTCRVGDLRDPPSLKTRRFSVVLSPEEGAMSRWTNNELVARTLQCLHGAVFTGTHHVVTRDFMSWCVWDMRMAGSINGGAQRGTRVGPLLQRKSVGLDCLASSPARMESLFKSERVFDRFPLVGDSAANSSNLLSEGYTSRAPLSSPASPLAVATGLYGNTVVVWSNPTDPESAVTMFSADEGGVVSSSESAASAAAAAAGAGCGVPPQWKDRPSAGSNCGSAVDERSRRVLALSMHGSELCFANSSSLTRLTRNKGAEQQS